MLLSRNNAMGEEKNTQTHDFMQIQLLIGNRTRKNEDFAGSVSFFGSTIMDCSPESSDRNMELSNLTKSDLFSA